MSKGQVIKYFWSGTEQELREVGVRIPDLIEYLMNQEPVWVSRADQESYWETRYGLFKTVDSGKAKHVYSHYLSGMMLPRRHLKPMEKQFIIKYGNERLREDYGY